MNGPAVSVYRCGGSAAVCGGSRKYNEINVRRFCGGLRRLAVRC